MALSHCKVCNLEDFSDPDLSSVIREVFAYEASVFGDSFPKGAEYSKHWEVAMSIRALRDAGALRSDATILGVGAGSEATIFWLTNVVGRVFATDLYLQRPPTVEDFVRQAARRAAITAARIVPKSVLRNLRGRAATQTGPSWSPWMLTDAGRYWPGAWNRRRLVVQNMNALQLDYEDGTFDAVFSASSIEHFGGFNEVKQSIQEIHRVLRPGGVASVSTEFLIDGSEPGWPGVLMFNRATLTTSVLEAAKWRSMSPLDTRVSEPTLRTEKDFETAALDLRRQLSRHRDAPYRRRWAKYPHIVLCQGDLLWTSVHLALVKADG